MLWEVVQGIVNLHQARPLFSCLRPTQSCLVAAAASAPAAAAAAPTRDIKPENILFTADMRLKLCDFGLAINMREERAVTRAGTLVRGRWARGTGCAGRLRLGGGATWQAGSLSNFAGASHTGVHGS